jgi:chromate transport protein ChrA
MKDNFEEKSSQTQDSKSEKEISTDKLLLLENFLRDSQNQTLIVIIGVIVLVFLAAIFRNTWILLIGGLAFWVVVYLWYTLKTKTISIKKWTIFILPVFFF